MKRREFIACGGGAALAFGAGAWTGLWPCAGKGAGRASGARPSAVIFDDRFPESLQFGNSAAQLGFETRPIRGDVTELCLGQLRPLWALGEGALIGMTSAVSLLCIQQLAAEFWMRVVARVEHVPQGDATNLLPPLVQALRDPRYIRPARAVAVSRQSPYMPSRMPLVSWAITTRKEVPT